MFHQPAVRVIPLLWGPGPVWWIGPHGSLTPHLAAAVRGRPGKEAASEEQPIATGRPG